VLHASVFGIFKLVKLRKEVEIMEWIYDEKIDDSNSRAWCAVRGCVNNKPCKTYFCIIYAN